MDICMKMKLTIGLLYILQTCIGIQGEYTHTYLGCYKDKNVDRALSEYWYQDNNKNTVEYCLDFCSQKGYKYAGLEFGNECWCGNSGYNKHGIAKNGCKYKCPANKMQKCGGSKKLSVYAITYLSEPATTVPRSTTTSVPGPAASPTAAAPVSSLPVNTKSEASTTQTNTTITTNTGILPNTSTLLTNNSMVTAEGRADGNTSSANPRGNGNSTTYIGIGVGAVVVCAIIVLVVVLVVRRRRNSRESNETVQHKDSGSLAYSSLTIGLQSGSMELPGGPRYESVLFSSDETVPSVVQTPSNNNQSADNNSGIGPVYSLAGPIIDDLVVVANPLYG